MNDGETASTVDADRGVEWICNSVERELTSGTTEKEGTVRLLIQASIKAGDWTEPGRFLLAVSFDSFVSCDNLEITSVLIWF